MSAGLGRPRATCPGMACPRCHVPLRHETLRTGGQRCASCAGEFEAIRFDPVEVHVVVPDIAGTGPAGAAPCARHARNQAEVACGRCGQFMCSLCRIDADGKAYCPSCYDRLSDEGTLASTVTRVKNWAGWGGSLLLCSVIPFFAPVTSGIALVLCLRGIREKRARQESDGIARLWVIFVLNLLAVLLGVLLIVAMFAGAAAFGDLEKDL